MQIKESKTKYTSRRDREFVGGQNLSISTERGELEEVESFIYLGTRLRVNQKQERRYKRG